MIKENVKIDTGNIITYRRSKKTNDILYFSHANGFCGQAYTDLLNKIEQENSEIDMMNDVESSVSTEEPTSPSETMNVSEVGETEVNSIEAEEVSESIDIAPETETVAQEENDTKD